MSLWPADRNSVRKHLKSLGYDEVPDSVLDEFVADLNQFHKEQQQTQSALKSAQNDRLASAAKDAAPSDSSAYPHSLGHPTSVADVVGANRHQVDRIESNFAQNFLSYSPPRTLQQQSSDPLQEEWAYRDPLLPKMSTAAAAMQDISALSSITREDVRRQLSLMGYGSDIPEAVLDELVHELNDAYHHQQKQHHGKQSEVISRLHSGMPSSRSPLKSTNISGGKKPVPSPSKHTRSAAAVRGGRMDIENRMDTVADRLADLELSAVRSKVQEQQQQRRLQTQRPSALRSAQRPESVASYVDVDTYVRRTQQGERPGSVIAAPSHRPSTGRRPWTAPGVHAPVLRRRRNDPVNLFHQFKAEWNKSQFLSRVADPTSSKAKQRMFGGVGYHSTMGGNVVVVGSQRQNVKR